MKRVIAESGPESVGKTTTLRMFYYLIRERYPDADVENLLDNGKDIRALIWIGKVAIGIESQGDPWKKTARLEPSLAMFVDVPCKLIFCATRSSGGTVGVVQELEEHGYEVVFRPRHREIDAASMERVNRDEAEWLFAELKGSL